MYFFNNFSQDGRLVAGAGACEIELAREIAKFAETQSGLEQYSISKFATALESFPKILAENTGVRGTEVVSQLYAEHEAGNTNHGFDIEATGKEYTKDMAKAGVLDLLLCKQWAIRYAVNAACTILKIDQIIMAKRAGGPKPKQPALDNDDD